MFLFSPKDVTEVLIHNGSMFYVYEIFYNEEEEEINVRLVETRPNLWFKDSSDSKEKEQETFVEQGQGLHSAIRVRASLFIMADETFFYVINMADANQQPKRFE